MWILREPVMITLLQQGPKLGPQGTAKGIKLENAWWTTKRKRLACGFCARTSGSHFCSKDPCWRPKGRPKEWKWEMYGWQKNINDLYVNCACACQDHTFVARIQVGTPRDNQRNENGKRLTGKNHKRLLMNFTRACQDHTFAATIQVGSQGAARGMKMENACWVKNYKRHLCEFSAHLPGLQFCNKDPSWDPHAQPKEWK